MCENGQGIPGDVDGVLRKKPNRWASPAHGEFVQKESGAHKEICFWSYSPRTQAVPGKR